MADIFDNKNVVIAGLGKSGQACVRFFIENEIPVTVWDSRENTAVPEWVSVPVILGQLPTGFWQDIDIAVVSPGLALSHPVLQEAQNCDVQLIGEIELFSQYNQAPTIGITGSNGKTTVTLLVTHILKEAGLNAIAAGNVGTPALSTLSQQPDWVVLELSSFQLETTYNLALQAATILNISDDHLDRHKTLAAYSDAKQRIYEHAEHALCWRNQQVTYPLQLSVSVTEFSDQICDEDFGVTNNWITWQGDKLVDLSQVQLSGAHNSLNIQAAIGLAIHAGVDARVAGEAVYSFAPVAHRCVEIAHHNGVSWIDDSKATNVGAAQAAICGIGEQCNGKVILIAGGDAKGADLQVLREPLSRYVDVLITLGKDGPAIAELHPNATQVTSMEAAVRHAFDYAKAGDVVLLSPACASLDMFESYEHRAEVYQQAIQAVCI